MTPRPRPPFGPSAILLLAALIVTLGVLTVVSLETESVTDVKEPIAAPADEQPNPLKTVPWRQGVDPLLPHTLVVGVDIEPGTYTSQGRAPRGNPNLECTWARLRGLSGRTGDVIDSGKSWGSVTVTILATDKGFVTGGCAEWVGPAGSPE
ncbi:hypothetical protein GCM10010412_080440 [Nonomuraea recticatena]|uniref:Uncharacterized protein n=1 Tax=Nonomuraea recticatena TaxID=46178 RepID=A0ABN3T098_9ACTN